jgi:hypothetical protein
MRTTRARYLAVSSVDAVRHWGKHANVEQLFGDPPDDVVFETHETVDLTAGRIETRRHTVCHKVDWMTSDRHYPGDPCSRTWP